MITPVQSAIGRTSTSSFVTILKFLWRNWVWIIVLISLVPSFIVSLNTAFQSHNYGYPLFQVVLGVTNADALTDNLTNSLRTNSTQVIGAEYPQEDNKLFAKIGYYWKVAGVVWLFLTYLVLIYFPFKIIYKIVRGTNTSKPNRNVIYTPLIGISIIICVNMALVIIGLLGDTSFIQLSVPDGNIYTKLWYVFVKVLPFHGVGNLFGYLTKLW